jgi:hypothetical protein
MKLGIFTLLLLMGTASQAQTSSYPAMAPIDQYRMTRDAEIELARSAAPESIARDAEIQVFGEHGPETAVKGKNGFVCLVLRSWAAGVDDPEFWNPKVRAPICLNAAAARSYLPHFVKKTEWALAGFSKPQIAAKLNAAFDSHELTAPDPGAMCYMMSKEGHLSDRDGHWHPHLMFFVPDTDPKAWGANLKDSPLLGMNDPAEHLTVFLLTVEKWSDGTPGPSM